MNSNGPLIVIDDDLDEQELFYTAYKRLKYKNEVLFFQHPQRAIEYLEKTETVPFLVLSDVNMPGLNGFDLRDKIQQNEQLQSKCIPYLFFSTSVAPRNIIEAYSKSAQGFFLKPSSLSDLESTITVIMDYWKTCFSPGKVGI